MYASNLEVPASPSPVSESLHQDLAEIMRLREVVIQSPELSFNSSLIRFLIEAEIPRLVSMLAPEGV
jgi:hypothetical protein